VKSWTIEYEIPPLRAIYWATVDAESEEQVRVSVAEYEPRWRIRKITETKQGDN